MKIDINQIDNVQIEWNGKPDYPDFCNAFIATCDIKGVEATEEELEYINNTFMDSFYSEIYESLLN